MIYIHFIMILTCVKHVFHLLLFHVTTTAESFLARKKQKQPTRKCVLKICSKSTVEHPNLQHIFRSNFHKNTSEGLLLKKGNEFASKVNFLAFTSAFFNFCECNNQFGRVANSLSLRMREIIFQ